MKKSQSLAEQSQQKQLELFVQSGEELSKRWEPHETQALVIRALFHEKKKLIVVECGRQWGKSELICCIAWWWGRIKPGSQSIYFSPWVSQSRDILWTPGRAQNFGPEEWVRNISDTYMRLDWSNSNTGFFRLGGTNDDVDKTARGIYLKDGFLAYDEARDIKDNFFEIADPITARFDCPILIFTSPPEDEYLDGDRKTLTKYCQLAEEAKSRPDGAYFNFPTSANPHIPRPWLERKKASLYALGQGWLWEREYEAKRVSGAEASLFPMLKREEHVVGHSSVLSNVRSGAGRFSYWALFDPGNRAAFAALFLAWDQRSGDVWVVDEIYEKDQMKNTAQGVWTEAKQKMLSIYNSLADWIIVYDEAALWFANEVRAIERREGSRIALRQTNKSLHKKEDREPRPGISIVKQMMLTTKLRISDICSWLYWELEKYRLDREGRLPKKNDHLIDLLHYFVNESGYMPGVIDVTKFRMKDTTEVYDLNAKRFEDHVADIIDAPYYYWNE